MVQPREAFDDLPTPASVREPDRIRDLGDGLVLRHACEGDVEAIARFQAVVHADPPDFAPQPFLGHWTRELMGGGHPRTTARDWVLVHDTKGRRVASALCLVPMDVRFGSVPLRAAQIELVGTHPGHRNRGLVRMLIDEVHGWADAAGSDLTLIDGIPWYYRQFGYEMAVEVNASRLVVRGALPRKRPAEADRTRIRPATDDDMPVFERLHDRLATRHRFSCVRDAAFWRFERSRHPEGPRHRELRVIEDDGGRSIGAMAHTSAIWDPGWLHLGMLEIDEGVAWTDVAPGVLWHLRETGLRLEGEQGKELLGVALSLGSEHPLYDAIAPKLVPGHPGYALYVRVPRLVPFLRRVAPVLEANLAASSLAGHSGALALSFYRDGVRLALERGRIVDVAPWRPATDDRGDVGLPDRTFLQLLFGRRSLDELRSSFPDCFAWNAEAVPLVEALLPKQPSDPWTTL